MKWKLIIALLFICATSHAQKEKIVTKKGNSAYQTGEFEKAVQEYERALELKDDYTEAAYNLGNSFQRQADIITEQIKNAASEEEKNKLMESFKALNMKAASIYSEALENSADKEDKSRLSYNRGNALLRSGELEESINAYKEALRNNPRDEDARYNLSYAKQMLKKQEQEQQQKEENQDKEENQEEKKEEKDPNQDNKEKPDEQKEDQQQQKPKPDQLSKEDVEKMLDALNKNEKEIQEDLKKEHKAQRITIEKDW